MPAISKPSTNGHKPNGQVLPAVPGGKNRLGSVSEVSELARDPNLMKRIEADIAALGVVGETESGLLIYVVGTSRKLPKPLATIIRGPSSGGKSSLQMAVASMFPPEEVIEATSLTPNALFYGDEGWLKHKFLVKGERSLRTDEEGQDATGALRQLLSEGRISKLVTVRLETKTILQEGPVAFCETTTAASIFEEDLNRCLQIHVDDSAKQTRRIVLATAKKYREPERGTGNQLILDRHREFQRSLESVDVVIPYSEVIAAWLPDDKLESRRVINQVCATIQAIALLHQYQRDRRDGKLIATREDYAIARRLLIGPLQQSLGCGDRVARTYSVLKKRFPKGFDSTEVMDSQVGLFSNKVTRDRRLKEMVRHELLIQLSEGKAKTPARWAWTGNEIRPVLPAVKDLET